ncbi:MAG: PAS domain S-box protein [Candidatus Nomurabacteria bacterium GW2011_GWA2_43_15]|uniref:histidine kinase n=1 Tax=Candidatus Nomurabacteria bacterium GW2011_GWA2_43_15 TaxID=1618738 RepID=A0A0G1G056_9BACT|nr:MAG: PAS domain S-box protein [Candidatus Nomurabacteria bacterium GW2011_GWA2_43_15]
MAVLITGSFIFMSERFIGIANDAQERLINVRIGSLQDAFVSFAGEKINDTEYLNKKISDIIKTNETIKSFKVIVKRGSDTFTVIASNNEKEINQNDPEISFLYGLASSDPSHSITITLNEGDERLFKTSRAVTDESGNILGMVTTTQTLSLADRMIEKDIKNSRILLIFVIIIIMLLFLRLSRIIDYIDLYKKLKEVDQLKDDFISMASHELRTPLSVIRGYAEFIREAPELSPQTKDYTSKIDISAKDLDTLVSDILDVSRIEQGRISFSLEKINPGEITEKVVSNLVGNAIKYTKQGEIKVKLYKENGFLRIRVSDTGIGMSEEEKSKLFEKFYRIRTEETKEVRGTGLGLWITNQIVKEMKGKISVESIKGVGSHFIVSFPIIS